MEPNLPQLDGQDCSGTLGLTKRSIWNKTKKGRLILHVWPRITTSVWDLSVSGAQGQKMVYLSNKQSGTLGNLLFCLATTVPLNAHV